ncbi:STM4015 family protein [Streptomyces cadmiisoli]|uniref:Leucine-rich repeat domain-containing protein n=1 Tax=Streptomyces cadmiisoli TaxID=2184053 RepID=A0A2Z4JE49_9ACTN|nr:leucine-rich repeat domain-containing protein [Streptomyces cadmiisoli]
MSNAERPAEWGGLPTFEFPLLEEDLPESLPAADAVAWRITVEGYYDVDLGQWAATFARFAEVVDLSQVRALIVGIWPQAAIPDNNKPNTEAIDTLVAAADRLPALRALFIGDMTWDECEISWIVNSDVTPLLRAFPRLEEFGVRGGGSLAFPAESHSVLRRLVIETGALSREVVRGVGESDLPALEDLDIWLGDPEYGADTEVSDLEPFMTGVRLPALRRLALRNSAIQDEIAAAFASAPVVARLTELNLSLGTLGDEGATALLDGQPLTHLAKLDLHHHYISAPVAERIRETLTAQGVAVDLSEGPDDRGDDYDDEEDGRYVAVAE